MEHVRFSRRWRALLLFGPLAVGAACAGADQYVYTARRYDADAGCLEPYASIGVITGDSVSSTCSPICFRLLDQTFTSTMCPPLPTLAVALDAEAPECLAAASLFDGTCGGDAGIPSDGGDASKDAAVPPDAEVPLDASDDGG